MDFYLELTILEDSELNTNHLWNKIYQQIHLALVENGNGEIAASFPEYDVVDGLGKKLRLFATTAEALEALDLDRWLERYDDYVHRTKVRRVPVHGVTCYAVFSREHRERGSLSKAKRYAKRHGVSLEEAEQIYRPQRPQHTVPYINMRSLSTGNNFCLYIEKKEVEAPQIGTYGTYGLSDTGTVPIF